MHDFVYLMRVLRVGLWGEREIGRKFYFSLFLLPCCPALHCDDGPANG